MRDTYTNLRVKVDQLRFAENLPFVPVHGVVLAKLPTGDIYRYGDRVRLHGRLETPPVLEDFSYGDYLALRGIYANMGRVLTVVYQIYPDPEASLLAGILLGVDKGIPEQVQEDFKKTGTAHIIAISGLVITPAKSSWVARYFWFRGMFIRQANKRKH